MNFDWFSRGYDWLQAIISERFGDNLLLSRSDGVIRIRLAGSERSIALVSDLATFSRRDSSLPCSVWDATSEGWRAPLGSRIPAPGSERLPQPLIEERENEFYLKYDVLGLAWWMLSRQEEVGRVDLDAFGRFPAESSHAFKHDYLDRPVVDEWLDVLGQVMSRAWPSWRRPVAAFEMLVSHDVDHPSRYAFANVPKLFRTVGGDLLKRRDLRSAAKSIGIRVLTRDRLLPNDPMNTFDWLMTLSEKVGIKSAFYFICGRTSRAMDALYEPEHPAIRTLMREIHVRGHEIGLHPSYNTYRNPTAIAREARRLKEVCADEGIHQSVWGGRMHFLRWETPTTPAGWELGGMDYDSSLGYADRPGFRAGTCHEYPAVDPTTGQAFKLRIRPLIAMECTVMAPRYMGLGTGAEAKAKFLQLKEACRAVGGDFTLLWHNSRLDTPDKRALYASLLGAEGTE
ncbi:MAG: polysaccharide deacetylase family protein [Luteimonas sp.]